MARAHGVIAVSRSLARSPAQLISNRGHGVLLPEAEVEALLLDSSLSQVSWKILITLECCRRERSYIP